MLGVLGRRYAQLSYNAHGLDTLDARSPRAIIKSPLVGNLRSGQRSLWTELS